MAVFILTNSIWKNKIEIPFPDKESLNKEVQIPKVKVVLVWQNIDRNYIYSFDKY